MRCSRLPIHLLLVLLLTFTAQGVGAAVPATSSPSAAPSTTVTAATSASFPRIGEYNGFGNIASQSIAVAPLWSRYNLAMVPANLTWRSPSTLSALRQNAPQQTILAYDRTYLLLYTDLDQYGTDAIYPGWWLLQAGSTLAADINSTQTTIPVVSTTPFKLYDDVLVDAESMHIVGINTTNKTLTVQRGFYSKAAAHSKSRRIAPHAHGPYAENPPTNADPSNPADRRSWALNLSVLCPKNPEGLRFIDFLARWTRDKVLSNGNWSGMFFDNTNDLLYDNRIDVNNDNIADGGWVTYNGVPRTNVWEAGIDSLFAQVRAYKPGAVILGDGFSFSNTKSVNGQNFNMMEVDDAKQYTYLRANYPVHMQASVKPSLSFVNTRTRSGPADLRIMRYGLGTTLLDNGVYIYDRGPFLQNENAPAWWFDEFSKGAGTALTSAINDTQTTLPVVNSGSFRVGDIVWVDREAMKVTSVSAGKLVVSRGANSTRRLAHDSRSVVATITQIKAGAGYLGQPTGAAAPVGPVGSSILLNSTFEGGTLAGWETFSTAATPISASIDSTSGQSGNFSAKVVVSKVDGVNWHTQFRQTIASLNGPGHYVLRFRAKASVEHKVQVNICSTSLSTQCFVDYTVPVNPAGWIDTEIPFSTSQKLSNLTVKLILGDVPATTWFDTIEVRPVANPITRRNFQRGTVLVNHTSASASVNLTGAGYCFLRGDQNPSLNSGATATTVTVPARDARILVACDAAYIRDQFTRKVSSGWGNADRGGAYSLSGTTSDFFTDGSSGIMRLARPGTTLAAYLPSAAYRDVQTIYRVRTDRVATGSGQYTYFVARRQSNGDEYRVKLRFDSSGQVSLHTTRVVNGSEGNLGQEKLSTLAHKPHTFYWVRALVTGSSPTTIRFRVWLNGQPEPNTWMYSVQDSTASLQQAGIMGLRAAQSSSATNSPTLVLFDDWRVAAP